MADNKPTCCGEVVLNNAYGKDFYYCRGCRQEIPANPVPYWGKYEPTFINAGPVVSITTKWSGTVTLPAAGNVPNGTTVTVPPGHTVVSTGPCGGGGSGKTQDELDIEALNRAIAEAMYDITKVEDEDYE